MSTRSYNEAYSSLAIIQLTGTSSETEILDVAPIDIFNGLSKEFVSNMPDYLLTDDMRKQALEVEYHWVTENGEPGRVTAGGKINATVRRATSTDAIPSH